MTLGERIKTCRQKVGMSQEKVAELVGVSRQAVTKWESNQSAPNTENLFKLAEIFVTTVDMLLEAEKETKQSPAEQIYYLYKMVKTGKKHYMCANSPCGAGLNIFGITPKGDIFPCCYNLPVSASVYLSAG